MMRRCVSNPALAPDPDLTLGLNRGLPVPKDQEHDHDQEQDFWRSRARNDSPCPWSFSSNFAVQSQSQHAHGSVPFSCRQFRRECASLTVSNSKYFSQCGRSSSNGGSQKHVSTQVATPLSSTRACRISC